MVYGLVSKELQIMISNALKKAGHGWCMVMNGDGIPRCPSTSYDGCKRQVTNKYGRHVLKRVEFRRIAQRDDGMFGIVH